MSSSDSVATATENASRLGYKHVCVNYLHVASHDYQYQEVIQHTHRSTHSPSQKFKDRVPSFVVTSPSLQVSLQVRFQVSQSLSLQVFHSCIRPNLIHIQQVGLSIFYLPSFWTNVLLLFDCCSFFVLFDLAVRSGVADVSLFFTFA